MAAYSSILAWRIPWAEEPGGLQSMVSQRVGHDWMKYRWLTMLYIFLYCTGNLYTYIQSFKILFSIMVYHRIMNIVLYIRTLLFIHSKWKSLHIHTTSNHPSPSPPPLGSHKSVFYVYESVSVLQINSFVSYFRFHIWVKSYDICLSLSDLLHLVWQFLGPSMLHQMALLHSFLWLSSIPLYICTTSSLSSYPSMELRLFTCFGYCQ